MKIPKGTRIGFWTVTGPETRTRQKPRGFSYRVRCRCICGKEKHVLVNSLKCGESKSCGCQRKTRLTHGKSGTPEYLVWLRMKQRCYDPNATRFEDWGGRGNKVCSRWKHSFPNFLKDMGAKPTSKHSLDRLDNAQDYSLENCRWATPKEQARNSRHNRYLTHDGLTLILQEWSERTGIASSTIRQRIDFCGWSVEKALTTPVRKFTRASPSHSPTR
jgi:hypothetical protein